MPIHKGKNESLYILWFKLSKKATANIKRLNINNTTYKMLNSMLLFKIDTIMLIRLFTINWKNIYISISIIEPDKANQDKLSNLILELILEFWTKIYDISVTIIKNDKAAPVIKTDICN